MDNPYQAPQTSEPVQFQMTPSDRILPETPVTLDPSWCFGRGWKLTCGNFKIFFLAITLPLILNSIFNNVLSVLATSVDGVKIVRMGGMMIEQANFGVATFIVMIITNIIGIWIGLGIIRATLDFLDGKTVSFFNHF